MYVQRSKHAAPPRRRTSLIVLCAVVAAVTGLAAWQLPAATPAAQPASASHSVSHPTSSVKAAASSAAPPSRTVDRSAWQIRLVNATHPLPANFTVQTVAVGNARFDARAADALRQLMQACNRQGNHLLICSGWRSISKQSSLYQDEIYAQKRRGLTSGKAESAAAAVVAPPGTSEHNLGLAVDFGSSTNEYCDETFARTPEGKWLAKNAWQYGFILRYPQGKEKLTGIVFEPWHYRYVGLQAAKEIRASGQCLEEYVR